MIEAHFFKNEQPKFYILYFKLFNMTWTRNQKTNKSLSKRVRLTGGNKIMKRPPHQNHFNAKESGNSTRGKKGEKRAPHELNKIVKALLTVAQI